MALLSITAAGVGLTLTRASVVVFAELAWNVAMLKQAEDRAHRIGQRACTNVHYCIAEGTLDDMMWRTVERKFRISARRRALLSATARRNSRLHLARRGRLGDLGSVS